MRLVLRLGEHRPPPRTLSSARVRTIRSLKVGELEVGGRPWPGPANTIEPGR